MNYATANEKLKGRQRCKVARNTYLSAAQQAKIAETNFNKLSKEAAEATLASDASTFAERNRARIILKRLAKGKKLKAVA